MPALSLTEVKADLRVEHTADDALISALIERAQAFAENMTGRTLGERTRVHSVAEFGRRIALPGAPVISITQVEYLSPDGALVVLPPSQYALECAESWPALVPAVGVSWPAVQPGRADAVRITYVAGYGDDATPPAIKQWMSMCIGTWFANRESIAMGVSLAELPRGAYDALLDAYRVNLGM